MNLTIDNLQEVYRSGAQSPRELITELLCKCKNSDPEIWIHLLTEGEIEPYLQNLEKSKQAELPLYGVPFAIKDNIDLAGIPTTAGCPEYAYVPAESAFVVQQLVSAGAIPLGKTNLDQFATGLVGTRSPYGACKNSFNPEYISGGSSSGSAVAVAKGLCSFSLGTDTAGSGRVPAAFNNLLGVKPTRGLLSTRGVVPACRTLDCVSIFALCAGDADKILKVAAVYDKDEPFSRKSCGQETNTGGGAGFTYGVPADDQLQFFGNSEYQQSFYKSLEVLDALGGQKIEIDFAPFLAAAKLLYDGPWVEERTAAVGKFLATNPRTGYPVTRKIICSSKPQSAVDVFKAMYSLQALKAQTDVTMNSVDLLVTPTAGTCYTIAEEQADPIALNSNLGYYTNYMNLLDYCSLAVPTALTSTVPFGVTLVGRAFQDPYLLTIGAQLHHQVGLPMGTGDHLPPVFSPRAREDDLILLAVCGAHLQGLPLHHQLVELNAKFIRKTTTSPCYQMFALSTKPPKPGLIRDEEKGAAIEVEVYGLSASSFGRFVAQIPHPLGIGKLLLKDKTWVPGFIAEPVVAEQGKEITAYGSWRAYLAG